VEKKHKADKKEHRIFNRGTKENKNRNLRKGTQREVRLCGKVVATLSSRDALWFL
jgi:hypothetical protein